MRGVSPVRWGIAFAALSVVVTGYRLYFHNQALQIPLVRLLNDPSLYRHDPFAATLPYYASGLWRVVAWGASVAPLEFLLPALFLVERFAVIYAVGNLALAFAPRSRAAMIASMAFFATDPIPILGGGTILLPYFEQTGVAIGLLMMATAAFHRRRPAAWAIWLALAFNCNSLYGVYALTYFGAAFAVEGELRRDWRRWLVAIGVFAVLSLPVIAMSAAAFGRGDVNTHLWIMASRARVPHHIFPSTWPLIRYARFAVLLVVVGCGVGLARHSRRLRGEASVWMVVSASWVLFAMVGEATGSPRMMILQPARASDLWYCFGVIALMAGCAGIAERRSAIALGLIPFALFHPGGVGASGERLLAARGPRWTLISMPGRSMTEVCHWAADTPKDSVFLVNPNWGEFRAMSARPAFVTWKDGSALLWDRTFAVPWSERIGALGYDVTDGKLPGEEVNGKLDDLYDGLTDSAVLRLAARYRLDYWVVESEHDSRMPVVHANRFFKVLRICKEGALRASRMPCGPIPCSPR